MDERRAARRWGLAGVVVGVALCAALVLTGVLERDHSVEGPEASEAFLAAWSRSRTATFVAEGEWQRTRVADGAAMQAGLQVVQQPPDRLQYQFGAIRGSLGGQQVRCNTDPDGTFGCFRSDEPAGDYAASVAEELRVLSEYFIGDRPLYVVRQLDAECFEFDQDLPFPDPPYGHHAVFCFDAATGALRSVQRDLGHVIEEMTMIDVRAAVSPVDFDLTVRDAQGPLGDPDLVGEPPAGPLGPPGG